MPFERKYSDEVRDAAVRRVVERRQSESHNRSILREVAEEFGVGEQSLRIWVKRLDDGTFASPDESQPAAVAASAQSVRSPVTRESLLVRIDDLETKLRCAREEVEVLKKAFVILAADLGQR